GGSGARRRARPLRGRGEGRRRGHRAARRAQGQGELPGRAQRGAPGSRRHLELAPPAEPRGGGLRMSDAEGRVGLVLVSHSRALAEATEAVARQMTGEAVTIACAAGAGEDGAELGTNPVAIAAAIERVSGAAGAVVLMDLGSAILSAETALELVDPA